MDVYQNLLNFAAVESRNVKMMDTVALNTFMLDVPIEEVNFFKQIVKKMGWQESNLAFFLVNVLMIVLAGIVVGGIKRICNRKEA